MVATVEEVIAQTNPKLPLLLSNPSHLINPCLKEVIQMLVD